MVGRVYLSDVKIQSGVWGTACPYGCPIFIEGLSCTMSDFRHIESIKLLCVQEDFHCDR